MDENLMDEKFTHPKIMDDESSTWMKIFEKKIKWKGDVWIQPLDPLILKLCFEKCELVNVMNSISSMRSYKFLAMEFAF
jgi:hypothetical protein